ncbi:uncharacterized protein MKK02DRAFT_40909 [Dioszegia hungarica]|uniref:Plasma membrane proteolipid 3 n=1 Tax=Dioszegia hungarica TaxID=4972 RepID=A0AA38H4Q0_9TREE|nr:uncharacterized protein MKK02DRAFT_40909 [Dioszegia hungarica]KAI9632604.1 hypothetical protein MKK02DRAFT_40909 [Dioszegia hungarica]
MPFTCSDIIKIVLAIILPPLGVFLERGCNADFLINILLTSASGAFWDFKSVERRWKFELGGEIWF